MVQSRPALATGGGSLSRVGGGAVSLPRVAPVGSDRTKSNVSVGSATLSPWTLIVTVFWVSPTSKVRVVAMSAKSSPAVAVPPRVRYSTFTGVLGATSRVTVNVTGTV